MIFLRLNLMNPYCSMYLYSASFDMTSSDEEDLSAFDLFLEPNDYREVEKSATYIEYSTLSRETLRLRLVGHNPLWVLTVPNFSTLISPTDTWPCRVTTFGTAPKSYPHTSRRTHRSLSMARQSSSSVRALGCRVSWLRKLVPKKSW